MNQKSGPNLIATLNDSQAEAVRYCSGPLLVLAGAGSGKTRVLAHKFAWLVSEQGLDPRSIMAVTFTNKAAREMRERINRLMGVDPVSYTHLDVYKRQVYQCAHSADEYFNFKSLYTESTVAKKRLESFGRFNLFAFQKAVLDRHNSICCSRIVGRMFVSFYFWCRMGIFRVFSPDSCTVAVFSHVEFAIVIHFDCF